MEDEKRRALESVESVERAKEHEIERLRDAYETHVESSRKKTTNVEDDLKEEIECLLRENERTKEVHVLLSGEETLIFLLSHDYSYK